MTKLVKPSDFESGIPVKENVGFFYPTYNKQEVIPPAQSPEQLAGWLSSYHPEYHLNAWCFYGYLMPENDLGPISFSLNQQVFLPTPIGNPGLSPNWKKDLFELLVDPVLRSLEHRGRFAESSIAFNAPYFAGPATETPGKAFGWVTGGMMNFSDQATFSVTQTPFAATTHDFASLEVAGLDQSVSQKQSLISLSLVHGEFGQKGAQYMLTSDANTCQNIRQVAGGSPGESNEPYNTPENGRLRASVLVEDRFGIISQGNSTAAFAPQFVGKDVQDRVIAEYGGSLNRYLRATQDPMLGLGVYSYSIPFLEVRSFELEYFRDNQLVKSLRGKGGNLWTDLIFGTTDADMVTQSAKLPVPAAQAKPRAKWVFFAIPLTEYGISITTTQFIVYQDGPDGKETAAQYYTWANVVSADGPDANSRNPNGSFVPTSMLMQNQAAMREACTGSVPWTSQNGAQNIYNTHFALKFDDFENAPDLAVDLELVAAWDDQEVFIAEDGNVIGKYEGMFKVTGSIKGLPGHSGTLLIEEDDQQIAWGEIAPSAENN